MSTEVIPGGPLPEDQRNAPPPSEPVPKETPSASVPKDIAPSESIPNRPLIPEERAAPPAALPPVEGPHLVERKSYCCGTLCAMFLLLLAFLLWFYLFIIWIIALATHVECEYGLQHWPLAALVPFPLWCKGFFYGRNISSGRVWISLAQFTFLGVLAYGVQILRVLADEDRICATWFSYSVLICLALYFITAYIWLAVVISSNLCCTAHGSCPSMAWHTRFRCQHYIWYDICGYKYSDSTYFD